MKEKNPLTSTINGKRKKNSPSNDENSAPRSTVPLQNPQIPHTCLTSGESYNSQISSSTQDTSLWEIDNVYHSKSRRLDKSTAQMGLSETDCSRQKVSKKAIGSNDHNVCANLTTTVGGTHSLSVGSQVLEAEPSIQNIDSRNFATNDYYDIGDPTYECHHCKAFFWYDERQRKDYRPKNPTYSACCSGGKIKLSELPKPPQLLNDLIFGQHPSSKHFQDIIRSFNSMFSFTSMGGRVDKSLNKGGSPLVFRLCGQNYHRIGGLTPQHGGTPKFAQLYIYDTENEVSNRISSVRQLRDINTIQTEVVSTLMSVFDANNILVKSFRMARDMIQVHGCDDVKLKLISRRTGDGRTYNLPSVSEVAALIVGDFDESLGNRDILVTSTTGHLKRINEMHPLYLPLQYPLLFPYGEDGYRDDITISGPKRNSEKDLEKSKKVTFREFFSYRLHERYGESSHILFSRRLFQQFIVDAYTMIESWRLNYIRTHQTQLRCEMYKGLSEAII